VIYSLHDQVNGGFKYFEAPGSVGINDDHPTPAFRGETPLGVPSTLAGRPVPSRSRPVGRGQEARGIIVSPSAVQQSAMTSSAIPSGLGAIDGGMCPHWQRVNPSGECVDKWWAGPPVEWLGSGIGYALGGAVAGLVAFLLFQRTEE
jgi:hypothetical protein